MKKTEPILALISLLAVLMRIFHIPGADALLVICITGLTFIYFYVGFALFNGIHVTKIFKKDSYREVERKRILGGVVTGMVLSISLMGIMFKLLVFPGAQLMLIQGITGIAIVMIIALIRFYTGKDQYYKRILKRIVVVGFFNVILLSIPNKTWLNWNYPNNPDYVNAVLNAEKDSKNVELREKVEEEWKKMKESKKTR